MEVKKTRREGNVGFRKERKNSKAGMNNKEREEGRKGRKEKEERRKVKIGKKKQE